jgi:hypothetical protein
MKLLNILLNENIQITSKESVTKNGKPYKVILLTPDGIDEVMKEINEAKRMFKKILN